jgi:hypothetical protein
MRNPEAVHLKLHEVWIEVFQKIIEDSNASEFLKLKIVVVVAELYTSLMRKLAVLVEQLDVALIIVKRLAVGRIEYGMHHVLETQFLGLDDLLLPFRLFDIQQIMAANCGEAVVLHKLRDIP